ncbi:hypothetical protein CLU79DRAFT_727111 [Phycomyces nitens]|nr:hypothetical protein CLU79DRAFT_727111 [Phycomyces nitens]
MLVPRLPLEIIARIASFVPKDEMPEYILICRAWKEIFEIAMMERVVLSLKGWHDLVSLSDNNHGHHKKWSKGNYTKELVLHPYMSVRDIQYTSLQRIFPNIVHFDINVLGPYHFMQLIALDWKTWSNLRELRISFSLGLVNYDSSVILKVLESLSCLRRLVIHTKPGVRAEFIDLSVPDMYRASFTVEELETLHEHLPRLQYLDLQIDFVKNTNEIAIDNIIPAKDMDTLRVNINNISPSWLSYFAQKYPNIRIMELKGDNPAKMSFEYTDMVVKKNMTRFYRLTNTLGKLRKLSISKYNSDRAIQHIIYWNNLPSSKSKLCSIYYDPLYITPSIYDYRRDIIFPLSLISSKIEQLSIRERYDCVLPSSILETIEICPKLTYLDMKCNGQEIRLDTVLDTCVNIERLCIKSASVTTDKTRSNDRPIYGLQLLDMTKVEIEADVFFYISQHCPRLHNMKLYNVGIYRRDLSRTREFRVSMPHTNFQKLCLYGLQFYYLDGTNSSGNINFVLIPKNTQETDNQTIFSASTNTSEYSINSSDYSWRNICSKIKCLNFPQYYVREMQAKEIKRASQLFDGLYSTDSRDELVNKDLDLDPKIYGWEDDIHKGYVLFKCNHINTLEYRGFIKNPPEWHI